MRYSSVALRLHNRVLVGEDLVEVVVVVVVVVDTPSVRIAFSVSSLFVVAVRLVSSKGAVGPKLMSLSI